MNEKASGNSLLGSKRFQVIAGGGGLFSVITMLDVFPVGETILIMGQETEMAAVFIVGAFLLAILYGLQDIAGTLMRGLVEVMQARASGG